MPINFNTQAVQAFDVYRTREMNANTNIQKAGGALRTGGTGCGFFAALARGANDKAANNAARADFLLSLGRAYGIDGASVGKDGRATFSRAFMDSLEKVLGPAFKRSDYGLDAEGRVTSGKPLTARRIKAVLTRAIVTGDMAFSAQEYQVKLDAVLADLDARGRKEDVADLRAKFAHVQSALAFIKDELPVLLSPNDDYSEKADEDAPDEERCAYRLRTVDKNGAVDFKLATSKKTVFDYLYNERDFYLHSENFKADPTKDDFDDKVHAYIANVLETYVKVAVDLYLKTKGTGNFKAFARMFVQHAFCMEAKTANLQQFMEDRHIGMDDVEARDEVAPADHDEKTELLECLAREIQQVENAKPGQDLTWEKDYLPVLERHLVGLNRPQNGVLKPVTAEDIQALRGDVSEAILGDRDAL